MDFLREVTWSPYIVGAGIGILSWLSFLISKRPISCSRSFAQTSGMIERLFRGKRVGQKPYYQLVRLEVGWQFMLVVGVVIGSFLSASLSNDLTLQWVPPLWASTFGNSPVVRVIMAVLGGVFIGLGARWADGCTSGHGISGALQLSVASWISAICFFIGGILAAFFMYNLLQ